MQDPSPHERLVEDGEVGVTKTQLERYDSARWV